MGGFDKYPQKCYNGINRKESMELLVITLLVLALFFAGMGHKK